MTLLRPLLAAPSLLVLAAPADQLSFAPDAGASVEKTLEVSLEFNLEDFFMSFAGNEVTLEMMGEEADKTFTGDMSIAVTEQYVKSDNGRPLDLLRTFDALSLEMSDGSESEEMDEFTDLEGRTVRFLWSEDDDAYDVTFHEEDGDEEMLDGLSDDMDLRMLLPDDEVDRLLASKGVEQHTPGTT